MSQNDCSATGQYPAQLDCSQKQPTQCQGSPVEYSNGSYSYTEYQVADTPQGLREPFRVAYRRSRVFSLPAGELHWCGLLDACATL